MPNGMSSFCFVPSLEIFGCKPAEAGFMLFIKTFCRIMDQVDILIEGLAQRLFIESLFPANKFQCLPFDNECNLQRRIMPPKRNIVVGLVIAADRIGKLKGHRSYLG